MSRAALYVFIVCVTPLAGAQIALETTDGLRVAFDQASGAVTGVEIEGETVPLLPGSPGAARVCIGQALPPGELLALNFTTDGGPWTSAHNADWNSAGPYVTWVADEGGGHLRLGDGQTTGAGMAMATPIAVTGGTHVRIGWRARTASSATLQILCVRVYDADGVDITASVAAPPGWGWTSTSQAHAVCGLSCTTVDMWEAFECAYAVPRTAAALRVSLRYWTGGDAFVHIDDLQLDATGGIGWTEALVAAGPLTPVPGGFEQVVELPTHELKIETRAVVERGAIWIDIAAQDLSAEPQDRPLVLTWALPIDATNWSWWDDLDTARYVGPGERCRNTFVLAGHDVGFYPLGSMTSTTRGVALGVAMGPPTAQRCEYDPSAGLQSVWELSLTPQTLKLGAGRAAVALVLFRHAAEWGFRAAVQRYQTLFPDAFVKRATREGAWMYPILPSQIPNPQDFGFAWLETWGLTAEERALCAQLGISIFYYTEPWLAWQPWGSDPNKPPYAERVARLETWASGGTGLATWQPEGGVGGSGHVVLGDGMSTGAGLATAGPFVVPSGESVSITWQARAASTETTQILGVRLYDAEGNDITATRPAPPGWFWSPVSAAHVVFGFNVTQPDAWEPFTRQYAVPTGIGSARLALRYYNSGHPYVHADELRVVATGSGAVCLDLAFESEDGSWVSAHNDNWDNAEPTWLRVPRQQAAEAVLGASPRNAGGQYLIDFDDYFWHEWTPGVWNQAWPLNPDPDLPAPSAFSLYRESWVLHRIEETDGAYIDSVTAAYGVGGWENRRTEHLAVSDSALTFSWADGGAVQLAPQAHAEFLDPIAAEVRGGGRLMMLNLFPEAMRFHAQNADLLGSEVWQLVEASSASRLRRALAGQKVVSNLLQWGWGSPTYITYEQMEQFIRGQLFWGFYPAVSSAGGPMNGGAPDRYFLHPELYERDRPLFQFYMPVIKLLGAAGWEPVTGASGAPAVELERFGAFGRGPVYLTMRGPNGGASGVTSVLTLDLPVCGLATTAWQLACREVLTGTPLDFVLLDDPPRLCCTVVLAAGEVGVIEITPQPVPNGDYDGDGAIGPTDLLPALWCLRGPGVAFTPGHSCLTADLDTDTDVDLADLAGFQQRYTQPAGPN